MERTGTERREVGSHDPSLSDHANALLRDELREVLGSDTVEVDAGAPHHERERHGGHSPMVAALIDARLTLAVTFFTMLVVGAVASIAIGSWWALVGALAVHAIGTLALVGVTLQLTSETEHVSPETAAELEAEGVADPDRAFNQLLEDYRGRDRGPPA